MRSTKEAAAASLAKKRVAVTGAPRTLKAHGEQQRVPAAARAIPSVRGHPNTGQVEGDRCHPGLASISGGLQAVAIEAALIAGLIGVGMAAGPAVSGVLLYRLATYWLPVAPGWLSWRVLQRREYV